MASKSKLRTRPPSGANRRGALLGAILVLLGLVFGLVGCGTVQEHRARQYSRDFTALPPSTQERLRRATIARGDGPRAVYIALGSPDHIVTPSLHRVTWVYWGTLPEGAGATNEAITTAASAGTLRFISRSELGLPAGQPRLELRVVFHGPRVAYWTLEPIEREAASTPRRIPMGQIPTQPRDRS
jgi:hypothetical protein